MPAAPVAAASPLTAKGQIELHGRGARGRAIALTN